VASHNKLQSLLNLPHQLEGGHCPPLSAGTLQEEAPNGELGGAPCGSSPLGRCRV